MKTETAYLYETLSSLLKAAKEEEAAWKHSAVNTSTVRALNTMHAAAICERLDRVIELLEDLGDGPADDGAAVVGP